jgi:hypothetical protein
VGLISTVAAGPELAFFLSEVQPLSRRPVAATTATTDITDDRRLMAINSFIY